MNRMTNNFISSLKLLGLYRNVFSLGHVLAGGVNAVTGRSTGFPLTINLLATNRCNYSCRMCVSNQNPGPGHIPDQDMNLEIIRKLILEVRAFKPIFHIGGGEPLMRKDMPEILRTIKENNLKCLMTTNGFLMDDRVVDVLIETRMDVIIVSLYGTEGLHDAVVGRKGAFQKTIENLQVLISRKKRHMRIVVSTIALPESVASFSSFAGYLKSLGVDAVKIEQLNFLTAKEYSESALIDANGFDLTPSVLIQDFDFQKTFVDEIIRLKESLPQCALPVAMKPYTDNAQLKKWYLGLPERNYHCGFITHSVFINYNGDVLPCQFFSRCVLGNIRKDSLQDVWKSDLYQRLRKTIKKAQPKVCRRCCKN